MPRGRPGQPSEHAVNRIATVREAMQTAIAQELRARYEAPQELPPDLIALIERMIEQLQ
jgi:hypothetical protein